MSCCCTTPQAASLGFSIYLLIGYIPSVFYVSVGLAFEWEDLDSKTMWALILLASMSGAMACFLALTARWVKDGRKLDLGAAIVGAISLILSIVTTIWFITLQLRLEWLSESLQARILVAGGTIMSTAIFLLIPQGWACWIWRQLSALPDPSAGDDEAALPLGRRTRGRAPPASSARGGYQSDSSLDGEMKEGGQGRRSMGGLEGSDSEGEMYPRRANSMSKSGRGY